MAQSRCVLILLKTSQGSASRWIMARSGSNKTTVSVDAPIMIVTDGTPVWGDEKWPMKF